MLHPSARRWRLGLLSVLVAAAGAFGQDCGRWLGGEPAPGAVGSVRASVRWDPDGAGPQGEVLVVAGSISVVFTTVVSRVAVYDGTTWSALGSGIDGEITALAVHNGDLYIGGGFTTNASPPVTLVARWSGSTWQSLGAGIDDEFGSVNALVSHAGSLYVGGEFASAGGQTVSNIARWDGAAWHDVGGGTDAPVQALYSFNGDLIAGGSFTAAGLSPAPGTARWNGSTWSPMGTLTVAPAAFIDFAGELYAGGLVDSLGEFERGVVRWDFSEWQPVGSWLGGGGEVTSLAIHNGALHVGGGFSGLVDGWNIAGVAKRDNGFWTSPTPEPVVNDDVYTVASFGGKLIVGGFFFGAGPTSATNLAIYDPVSGWQVPPTGGFDYNIEELAEYQGQLVVAGAFASSPSFAGPGIVRYNGATWSGFGQGVSTTGFLGQINAAEVYNGQLVVGGNFNNSAGSRLSAWDEEFSEWLEFGGGANNLVDDLITFQGDLLAAGNFTSIGGVAVGRIAAWDGLTWSPVGAPGGSGFNNRVRRLGVFNGELIATGDFTSVDGTPILRIARFDGAAWHPMGAGLDRRAVAMVSDGTSLYIGGNFDFIGGVPIKSVARWDGSAWHPVGGGMQDDVRDLVLYNGSLVVAGTFQSAGAEPIPYLARWNGSQWSSFGSGVDFWAEKLRVFGSELIVAGKFNSAGGQAAVRFARWTDTGAPMIAVQPQPATVVCGQPVNFSVTPATGYTGLTYQWRRNGIAVDPVSNPSAATPNLIIASAGGPDSGEYTCLLSNTCGSVVSTGVTIDLCPADVNCSGDVSVQDIFDFLGGYFSGAPTGDFNRSGGNTVQDIFDYLGAYFAGCP